MSSLILTAVFFLSFILQTSLLRMFGSVSPDFFLLTSLYCGLRYGKFRGIQIGVISGLSQDFLSYGLLGINLLAKGLVGFLSGYLREMNLIIGNSFILWIILILASTGLDLLLLRVALTSFYEAPLTLANLIFHISSQTILNVIIGVPFFFILDRLDEYMTRMSARRF